ncbi:hypothetical protein OAN307_c25810 [Octadecabacter antarcticus 307]|uniref:Uncharacterized protein n=1 Tax=Octadecabacter antarcticus 307 TaxID=391626 RepID=M9RCN3_9RHOB|nr:hypothetical protein OAN307_c25810 [Octadecabacter antarcticus 307]
MHVNMHRWAVGVAGNLTCVFVFVAGDLANIGIRAAFGFGWAGLTDQFRPTIFCPARHGWASTGIGGVAAELLERLTFWADVLFALRVPLKISAAQGAIGAVSVIPSRACYAIPCRAAEMM